MSKKKFIIEQEVNASKKMLFQYLNTASGLAQWFADDVTIDENHIFTFKWDSEVHKARVAGHRANSYVRYEFIEPGYKKSAQEESWYIEFRVEENELTQSVFLKVIECSDMEDQEEQRGLWENLFDNLKETIGG